MEIKKLNQDDATLYQKIRLQALIENPEYYGSSYEEESRRPIEFFRDRLNQENVFTFGAFIDQDLIGVITLSLETRIKTNHIADIFGMYVDKNHRKMGIGKVLMNVAINKAKSDKIERIRLSVTESNDPAYNMYKKLGFIEYGKETHAIKIKDTYYNFIHMNLDLKK
jgi:ribosomal protein S18 acetylase RimI-like enzyme